MSILKSTDSYEEWLGGIVQLDGSDLDYKHVKMADGTDAFPFFRGTYYRWAKRWPEICPKLSESPRVLAVGDLHIENFGTWRDAEARLCWGVNDFDEADELPYAHDLVRLAASVRFARTSESVEVKFKSACAAILEGYRTALGAGGKPFVLEEHHSTLRALATSADDEPDKFWKKLTEHPATEPVDPPDAAKFALLAEPPFQDLTPEYRRRLQVGMGSLGKPRFLALAKWNGGLVAREAKAVTPPSTAWAQKRTIPSRAAELSANAMRSPDPYYRLGAAWIVRRLAPHCTRIELDQLNKVEELDRLLRAMGTETANVHTGTHGAADAILKDLGKRSDDWLAEAAKAMAAAVSEDWFEWKTKRPIL